jgi:hypothetical protein
MTNEEKLQQTIALAEEQRVAYAFMRKHFHEFHPCEANASLLKSWLTEQGLQFNEQNLEMAFQATANSLVPAQAQPSRTSVTEVLSEEELAEQERQAFIESLPPLPKSWVQITTAQDVHDLSASDYRRCFHAAPPYGDNFRKRVEAIMAHEKVTTNTQGWRKS